MAIAVRSTRFERFETDGGTAHGTIVAIDTGEGVDGTVLVSARYGDSTRGELVRESRVRDGLFRLGLEAGRDVVVQGHYLGARE